jgi:L-cysteine/cystine lyase
MTATAPATPSSTFDLAAARAAMPCVTRAAYLNAGTFGPLARVTHDAMTTHAQHSLEEGRIGVAGYRRFVAQLGEARQAFADVLSVFSGDRPKVRAEDLALNHCTTDGINTVIWGLTFEPGDEIITTDAEHPGLTAPLEALRDRSGVVVRVVAADPGAIRASYTNRTRLLAFSHVLWTDGEVLDATQICADARARGVRTLVDGAQSVGQIPVHIPDIGADFYTVSGQKWLCGPSGTGALWIHPDARDALRTPWPWYFSRQRTPNGDVEWPSAQRLDATTISMTSLAGLIAALRFTTSTLQSGGLGHAAKLANLLRSELGAVAEVSLATPVSPSQLVSFALTGHPASEVAQRLEREGILVRSIPRVGTPPHGHPERVRAAVGFWNDEDDVRRLVAAIRAMQNPRG